MTSQSNRAQSLYLSKIQEASRRLIAASGYLSQWHETRSLISLDSAALQVRKALESIAFAAIVPNEEAYAEFRRRAEEQKDFTKDYHAKKILRVLSKINPDFFPIPLTQPTAMPDGRLFFGRKLSGCLNKQQFEAAYDRLGRHLHSHNPWGAPADHDGLAALLELISKESTSLLELHATFIRSPEFSGAWVISVPGDGLAPHLIAGEARGEFSVGDG